MPKLTKRTVENLKIEPSDYFAWDDQIAGFGVRVMPSGVRTYQAQYRKGGRTRRVSLGRHGKITADQARKLALELMGQVAGGDNPAEQISQHRRAPTVAALSERFYSQHALERCKPSTQREYRRMINQFIVPAIGNFKIVDVERKDIADLHHKFRGIPYQANRTLGVLSKMFNLAEIWGLRPDGSNPCRHVPKYREKKRERYLSDAELQRLGQTLTDIDADHSEAPHVVAAFRLLILTGCRLGEIQTLRWEYITDRGMELPDTKTGARRIPLPQSARAILSALPRTDGNPYVIEGKNPNAHISDLQHPWRRVRNRAELPNVRIHDLRHTYASKAVSGGMPIQMVGKLLGHTQIQTTMRYAHLADDPVNQAAEENADKLASALSFRNNETQNLRIVSQNDY